MSTILALTNYDLVTGFEITKVCESIEAKASLELPKINIQYDGEESRMTDSLAKIFFPVEPSAPSNRPSILSRLVIPDAGSTHIISFMLPSQSHTLIFHLSYDESAQGMQEIPLTPPAKPRKPIPQETSYAHLPPIGELCDDSAPDDAALACDPIGYSSVPHSTPDMHPMKPAGKLVRQQAFVDLSDALGENPESDEPACDPEDYVSPSTPAMQPIKPAGKLVRQQAFVDLADALKDDLLETPNFQDSSDRKDVPNELIFRMSEDGEREVRTVSPYPIQKS